MSAFGLISSASPLTPDVAGTHRVRGVLTRSRHLNGRVSGSIDDFEIVPSHCILRIWHGSVEILLVPAVAGKSTKSAVAIP